MYVSQNEYVVSWKKFRIHLRYIKCTITEFEGKVDVQNHEFGWVRFQNRFFVNH